MGKMAEQKSLAVIRDTPTLPLSLKHGLNMRMDLKCNMFISIEGHFKYI